jgi:hypothetical protein
METYLTIDEYMDTFLALLVAVGSLGSLIYVGLGFSLASKYLPQHEEKIKIEQTRKAVEEALRALLKVDHILIRMFQAINVKRKKYEQMKEVSIYKCQDLSPQLKDDVYEKLLALFIFQQNFKLQEKELTNFQKELQLNGMLLKTNDFEPLFSEFDSSIAEIINAIFFKSKNFLGDSPDSGKTIEFLELIPLNMNDDSNSLIKKYNKTGKKLREFLLSKI